MKTIHVRTREEYPIYIGCGMIDQLPHLLLQHNISTKNKLVCITDSNIAPLHLEKLTRLLSENDYSIEKIIIPAGEQSKNLTLLEGIIGQCLKYGLDRQSVILALGGGVVGDIAGFVAATYMRGIRYIHFPTTVIAHDSSIGGKVGINHSLGKNIIGAFYHPQFVLFDVSFLTTLPMNEYISGYAEVIKHALIQDEAFLNWLKGKNKELLSLQLAEVEEAIYHSCKIKASIVSIDERESGLRMLLNYGHTIGHALETVTEYNLYKHGEAIAIGMVGAAHIAEQIYGQRVVDRTVELLMLFKLPIYFTNFYSDTQILSMMKHDKKRREGKYTFVLLPEVGKAEIAQVKEEHIKEALRKIRKERDGVNYDT